MKQSGLDYDRQSKVLIIGDSGVGKSCFLMRFADGDYDHSYETTMGIEFKVKTLNVDSQRVKLQIWDTAGQERFRCISQPYYRGAQGVIIAYDCTEEASFNSVDNWLKQIEQYTVGQVSKVLIATKCDSQNRVVSAERGEALAESLGLKFFETSAKNAVNVSESFQYLAKDICRADPQDKDMAPSPIIRVPDQPKKSSCC